MDASGAVPTSRGVVALPATEIAARVRAGELRPIDPAVAAQILLQALFGLSTLCLNAPVDPRAVLERELDLLLHGLLPRSENGSSEAAWA
jgi:hypothetical protein